MISKFYLFKFIIIVVIITIIIIVCTCMHVCMRACGKEKCRLGMQTPAPTEWAYGLLVDGAVGGLRGAGGIALNSWP